MDSDFIVGIYNYREGAPAGYYLLHLLTNRESFELASVEAITQEALLNHIDEKPNGEIGPFENLSEMNQFAFAMCEKSGADWIGTISVKEYNQVIESSNTLEDYKRILVDRVNVMENIGKKEKAKGIMTRIFK